MTMSGWFHRRLGSQGGASNGKFLRNGLRRAAACGLAALAVWGSALFAPHPVLGFEKTRSRAERALKDGEYDEAEKLYRELLAKDGNDINARLGLSYALLKKRNLQDAYDHAARAIAINPVSARAHALLGSALLTAGDFRSSVEEFRTAISLKDTEALAIAGLAMVDFYEGRLDSSISGLRRAAFIDSGEPDFVFNLAQCAARTEHYKEAADAYERFLAIAPKTDADRRARIRGLIDFLRYLGKQSSLYVVSGKSKTVVPVEIPDNRPIIKVRLNGQKDFSRFVLDTGSGISVISDETAQRLGIRAVARGGMARAVGGGGKFDIVYGFLDSVELGEAKVSNVPVYIRRFYGSENPVDGYIGLSLINKFVATVDYSGLTFELNRDQRTLSNETAVVIDPETIEFPMRLTSSGFLSGEVKLDGVIKPLNFIIDTGASISVLAEQLAGQEEFAKFARGAKMRVYGAAGVADDVETLMLPKVEIGPASRERVRAAVLDLDPVNETSGFVQNGIIGGNFLRSYRVTFDFQRGVIRMKLLPVGAGGGTKEPAPHAAFS
jgi:predicted aspartyl protease/thioredoxin-like negative regulator of GroEL